MILTASSGIVLGTLLGSVILLMETPLRLKGSPSSASVEKLGNYTASYSTGAVASAETVTMNSRLSRLGRKIPGSIPFTELEINHYLSQFKSSTTNPDGSPAKVALSSANVRVEDGLFVLSTKIVMNPKTDRFEILVQAIGHFENRANGIVMKVDRLLMNSLAVPQFGGFAERAFLSTASGVLPLPAEIKDGWNSVREVELVQDKIVLVL